MTGELVSIKNIFQIWIPDAYAISIEENQIIVSNDIEGCGAISITYYRVPDQYHFELKEELVDFSKSIHPNVDVENVICTTEYCRGSMVVGQTYWIVAVKFNSNVAIFSSYNCLLAEMEVEKITIERILLSIDIFPNN